MPVLQSSRRKVPEEMQKSLAVSRVLSTIKQGYPHLSQSVLVLRREPHHAGIDLLVELLKLGGRGIVLLEDFSGVEPLLLLRILLVYHSTDFVYGGSVGLRNELPQCLIVWSHWHPAKKPLIT